MAIIPDLMALGSILAPIYSQTNLWVFSLVRSLSVRLPVCLLAVAASLSVLILYAS